MSMTKLIASSELPESLVPGFRIIDASGLQKFASAAGLTRDLFEKEAKPDKDHQAILLLALGDYERYGWNRNGDSFPKSACQKYHDTFVKHGHVYHRHANKDPKKSKGHIKLSAYNEGMGRIELLIHAHREKNAEFLDRLEKQGEVSFSMACKVPVDRCSVCNTLRKSAADPKGCDHIRKSLGKLAENGVYTGTFNDDPTFFDISFVDRPADRVAWSLAKAASVTEIVDSATMALHEGIYVPASVALAMGELGGKQQLLRKLAEAERQVQAVLNNTSFQLSAADTMVRGLTKAAAVSEFADETIYRMRDFPVAEVFTALADAGVVLAPMPFFKYALGRDAATAANSLLRAAESYIASGIFTVLEKSGNAEIFSDSIYDTIYAERGTLIEPAVRTQQVRELVAPLALTASTTVKAAQARAWMAAVDGAVAIPIARTPLQSQTLSETVVALAEKYASYKLSTLAAFSSACNSSSNPQLELPQLVLSVAQHMVTRGKI